MTKIQKKIIEKEIDLKNFYWSLFREACKEKDFKRAKALVEFIYDHYNQEPKENL